MGGATEHDEAMRWFLQKAAGGDILVIRASGSDGYNDYLYTDLGIPVNSVETIVFNNASAASDPYVLNQIARAEAIWMAGGDQWNYVSYWRDNQVEELLNAHINVKQAPIGGTSAGMAVLGNAYFTAQNGTVTSATALSNPYANTVTIGNADFIMSPYLANCITDTHYDDPDRRGRHITFLARLSQETSSLSYGIACDEYTAVCIDEYGIAQCYGYAPDYDDNVYFLQADCEGEFLPEICSAGTPLTWNREQQAVKVYHIAADEFGTHTFDLNDWTSGSGGAWQHWWVENGTLVTDAGTPPICPTGIEEIERLSFNLFPNPSKDQLQISGILSGDVVSILDPQGRHIYSKIYVGEPMDVSALKKGHYQVQIQRNGASSTLMWVKE